MKKKNTILFSPEVKFWYNHKCILSKVADFNFEYDNKLGVRLSSMISLIYINFATLSLYHIIHLFSTISTLFLTFLSLINFSTYCYVFSNFSILSFHLSTILYLNITLPLIEVRKMKSKKKKVEEEA